MASGAGCLRVGEVQRPLKSGMIVAVSAGSVAEFVPEPGDALHIAEILLDFQEGLDTLQDHAAIRESLAAHLLTPLPASTEMYSAWNALRSELNSMEVFQESVLELLLRQILIYLYRTCLAEEKPAAVSGKAAQERVNEVIQYIDRNILYLKNVYRVSEALGYNYSYLSHVFSAVTGRSLRDYFLQKRFEKAIELLRDNLSIAEVSAMLGYAAVHSFSRAFSRQVGRPPGSFQKKSALPVHHTVLKQSFDDFEGPLLEWEIDQVYGSMKTLELVSYPRHSGQRSLAMEYNVVSDWRVDQPVPERSVSEGNEILFLLGEGDKPGPRRGCDSGQSSAGVCEACGCRECGGCGLYSSGRIFAPERDMADKPEKRGWRYILFSGDTEYGKAIHRSAVH